MEVFCAGSLWGKDSVGSNSHYTLRKLSLQKDITKKVEMILKDDDGKVVGSVHLALNWLRIARGGARSNLMTGGPVTIIDADRDLQFFMDEQRKRIGADEEDGKDAEARRKELELRQQKRRAEEEKRKAKERAAEAKRISEIKILPGEYQVRVRFAIV